MPSTLGIVSSGYYDRPMWVVVGASASDYLNAYPINPYTGWGTKVAAPTSSPPAESQTHIGWNYTNTVVATCAAMVYVM